MYPTERQAAIVAAAQRGAGEVSVSGLSDSLSVTAETIRRDLAVLERQGVLRRHHGGATLTRRAPFELSLARRREENRTERRAVAARVVAELPREGVLLLDSGSMTLEIAATLPRDRTLVVVTNSLPVAALLGRRRELTVLGLPGSVRPVTKGVVGDWARQRLEGLTADVAVIGANGVSETEGASTTLPEEAEIKQAMMRSARRRILAVTADKFGTPSLCRVARIDEFDTVVTDERIDAAVAQRMRAAGPEVIVA